MKLIKSCSLALGASVVFFAIAASSQLTVDATGPIRERQRDAFAGSGSSIGRKLPLQVAIAARGSTADASARVIVEFTVTNLGKENIAIPVSPNPGDLEPVDPKASYTLNVLHLYVTSDKRRMSRLAGGADLYGSPVFTETLVQLAPGDSIRVLARLALPSGATTATLVAHAALREEALRMVGGQPFLDTKDLGSASSPEYSLQALFKSPD
jgi:hypothetical protein